MRVSITVGAIKETRSGWYGLLSAGRGCIAGVVEVTAQATTGRTPLPRYRLVRPVEPDTPTGPPVLDAGQSAVAAHVDGPLLVVGGPGTGKTTALVESVAARVAEGVDPANILVLTFGRRASTALRNRIEARIGRAQDSGRATNSEP